MPENTKNLANTAEVRTDLNSQHIGNDSPNEQMKKPCKLVLGSQNTASDTAGPKLNPVQSHQSREMQGVRSIEPQIMATSKTGKMENKLDKLNAILCSNVSRDKLCRIILEQQSRVIQPRSTEPSNSSFE